MILRPVRTTQPQGPARIDWSNPITRGLAGAVGVNSGTSTPILTGAPEYAATPSGKAYRWIDGANASARVPTATFTGSAFTLITVFTPRALGGGFKKIGGWQSGSGGGAFFNWDHGNTAYARAVELWAGGVTGVLKYPDVTLGRRTVWAAVVSGTNLFGYADGKLAGSATLTGTPSGWTTLTNGQTAGDPTGAVDGLLTLAFHCALSDAEIKSLSDNPWQIFAPDSKSLWVPETVSAGGGATVIPIGVQATSSVGTPSATGAANATPAGVSTTTSVGAPTATGGSSIAATALPAGVAASSAVGAPAATGAAVAQPIGVASTAYVGTPTIATGVSGVAVAYPAGVQAIGQVGTLIATGAAWTAAVGVQAVASVGTPTAYAGELVIYTPGAQTRPSRLQSSSRPSRLQTGTRASR